MRIENTIQNNKKRLLRQMCFGCRWRGCKELLSQLLTIPQIVVGIIVEFLVITAAQ